MEANNARQLFECVGSQLDQGIFPEVLDGGLLIAPSGSVADSARPALPNTVATSGTVRMSRSVCWSSWLALATESPGSADGTGSDARFNYPVGVAVDGAGNVYVADAHNHTIRKVTPAGVVSTFRLDSLPVSGSRAITFAL